MNLTPEQSEIIFEEYIAMNQAEPDATAVDVGEFHGLETKKAELTDAETDLAQRMKAELRQKLGDRYAESHGSR